MIFDVFVIVEVSGEQGSAVRFIRRDKKKITAGKANHVVFTSQDQHKSGLLS